MPAKKPQPKLPDPPSISLEQGLELIRDLIDEADELGKSPLSEARVGTWYTAVAAALSKTFGSDTAHIRTFYGKPEVIMNVYGLGEGRDPSAEPRRIARKFAERQESLRAIEAAAQSDLRRQHLSAPKPSVAPRLSEADERSVFVVHGHDQSLRESCARFLEHLGLVPIILHEQPNGGRTIIEKFEHHSNVRYAIVLLTGDDLGGQASKSSDSYQPRARQNVVFELGFFAGALGRARVCALYEHGVELPSDLSGLAYVAIDPAGAWKLQIARELKAAGLTVDMNRAI
jgi:predicted nucleotide-binding protein